MIQKPTQGMIRQAIAALFITGICAVTHLPASGQQAGEKIYVHTDKDEYLAGEILWFRSHFVDPLSLKPSGKSAILYTELIDSKGKPMLQGKVGGGNNSGDGSFYLPPQLPSGIYTFTAYTSPVKKDGEKYYFRKSIRIINTLSTSRMVSGAQKPAPAFISFFPEGGNALDGEPSKFGFCVLEPTTKKGLQATGMIIGEKNDTLARFNTFRFGLGQFSFTAKQGEKYFATIVLQNGTEIKKEFRPVTGNNAYALSVSEQNNQLLIRTRYKRSGSVNSNKAYLLFHAQNQSKHLVEIELKESGAHEYQIEKSKLGDGVTYITLLDANRQPVCERLVFSTPKSNTASLGLKTDKSIFSKRENIRIETSLVNAADTTQSFDGSMAITRREQSQPKDPSGIYEYLWLTAGLNGQVESPSFYFSAEAKADPRFQENLLLVHGWRYFNSTASAGKPIADVSAELKGHIISAKVIDTWTSSPKAGVLCALSVPSSPFGFYTATSDKNGIARFIVENYYGPGSIVIKAHEASASASYKFEILDPFTGSYAADSLAPGLTFSDTDSASLIQRSIAMQTGNTFQHDQLNSFQIPFRSDTLPFFGKPEYSYKLDNYTRFSTVEEVLREYVSSVMVSMKDSRLKLSVFDEKNKNFYNDRVLVLLDGVPLSDGNQIFNYDVYKIKKIDIVPRRYLYGPANYFGVVSFESYKGQFDATELDPTSFVVDYEGLQLKRSFYSPVYSQDDKGDPRIPDYRTTLLWQPHVQLTGNGIGKIIDSYTSDYPGIYEIVINGVSSSGEPLQKVIQFEVK
jgi:hypothetical protein